MYIDTPIPLGTILTSLLTHQRPWGLFQFICLRTNIHGYYFNVSIDTPVPMGTILTYLLTHQYHWGLF